MDRQTVSVSTYSVRNVQYISFFKVQLIRLPKGKRKQKMLAMESIRGPLFTKVQTQKAVHSPVLQVI